MGDIKKWYKPYGKGMRIAIIIGIAILTGWVAGRLMQKFIDREEI